MIDVRRQFGNEGEAEAEGYLRTKGYQIVERQWRAQSGEIDLIMKDGDEIVFVEVKARHDATYGYPEESVTDQKIGHLVMCAQEYLDRFPDDRPWRIDVIAIELQTGSPVISHFEAIDIPEQYW